MNGMMEFGMMERFFMFIHIAISIWFVVFTVLVVYKLHRISKLLEK